MNNLEEIRQRMMNDPIAKLEAIYNRCWRNEHNAIDSKVSRNLMSMIESVARERDIDITGSGGTFEFKKNPFDEPLSDILNMDTWEEL